jgi:hypothetical protein
LIGRPIGGHDENIKRNQFNQLIRDEYGGGNPIFDLAKIESTFPDGRWSSFTTDGKIYYSLVPDYTYDGGLLNETDRKKIAEQLLILLAGIANS